MNADRFGASIRALSAATSRRDIVRSLGAMGLGLGAIRLTGSADAKKKRKRKKKAKPATPNEFGCIDVGDQCTSAAQCCSGICEGKKGKQTCRAHDEGGCEAGVQPEFCGGVEVECTTAAGAPGVCATTTGNAGYCATVISCFFCATDLDCQLAVGGILGPRAACLPCAECSEYGGTACATRDVLSPRSRRELREMLHSAQN